MNQNLSENGLNMEIKQVENFVLKDLERLEGENEDFVNSLKLWMEFAFKRNLLKGEITKLYHRHQNALQVLIDEGFVKKAPLSMDRHLSDCDVKITSKGWKRLDEINQNLFKKIYYGVLPELKTQSVKYFLLLIYSIILLMIGFLL